MIILWDSADKSVSLEIIQGGQRWKYEWQADRTLALGMLQFLTDKLALHEANFSDIKGIGVMRGPGSYTGLRIGLTVMNTLAADQSIPIVGAIGDAWRSRCIQRLNAGEDDKVVLPEYGGEAHITKPRK